MNQRNHPYLRPALALLLAAGAMAAAHADGLYVGGNLGVSHNGDTIDGVDGGSSGASGKVYGGYSFTPNFGLEAGYADLGHVSDGSGSVKTHGEFVDAVGTLPLGADWALLGRLGVAHLNVDTSNGDDNGAGLKVGFGAQYSLTRDIALRGEWEHYRADAFGSKPNLDQYTFGVRFGF